MLLRFSSGAGERREGKEAERVERARERCCGLNTGLTRHSLGVHPSGVSGPHWEKSSCLGPHIKYTATHNHKTSCNVLSKRTILCLAAFTATLGCMRPVGCGFGHP